MKAMTVYLRPHSTLHGRRPPRSDTLFGAICWGYQLLFGGDKLAQFLLKFTEASVPFLISSMFQYHERNGNKVHFFPKPLSDPLTGDPPPQDLETMTTWKRIKKPQYVTDTEFIEMLRGHNQASFSQSPAMVARQIPHSAINRLTWTVDADRFFYTEEFSLASEAQETRGLFFCVTCYEEVESDIERDLKTVFYFLSDKGIGGKTSVGKGHFKAIEIDDKLPYTAPSDEESTHVVTLSLTYPDPELRKLLPESWYTLEKRQGKIESMYAAPASGHIWKDHLLMLQEGSTFPKTGQHLYGGNPIVRKAGKDLNFDIYQYGYAFTVNTRHVENMRPGSED